MNIFVGCSSRNVDNPAYRIIAKKLGEFIVEHKHNYVFGGCECGLMGEIYHTVVESKDSKIIVVQAKAYAEELAKLIFDEGHVLDTVNSRKDAYTAYADVLVFLPGGIGTIDEIMTAIETKRNHEHHLPIVIVNVDNFFAPLFKMFDKIYGEGFADIKNKECYYIANSFEDVKNFLNQVDESKYLS